MSKLDNFMQHLVRFSRSNTLWYVALVDIGHNFGLTAVVQDLGYLKAR